VSISTAERAERGDGKGFYRDSVMASFRKGGRNESHYPRKCDRFKETIDLRKG